MNKTMKKKLGIVIINIVIIILYLYTLKLMINPNVPIEYDLYYIRGIADTVYKSGSFEYECGEIIETNKEKLQENSYFIKGWNVEESGVWSVDNTIYIALETGKITEDLCFSFDAIACTKDRKIKVSFDDNHITTLKVKADAGDTYEVLIDKTDIDKNSDVHIVKIEFTQNVEKCSEIDQRRLGIWVTKIQMFMMDENKKITKQ